MPDARPLTNKFPVSAGLHHKASGETESAAAAGGSGGMGGAAAEAPGVVGGGGGEVGVSGTATNSVFGESKASW